MTTIVSVSQTSMIYLRQQTRWRFWLHNEQDKMLHSTSLSKYAYCFKIKQTMNFFRRVFKVQRSFSRDNWKVPHLEILRILLFFQILVLLYYATIRLLTDLVQVYWNGKQLYLNTKPKNRLQNNLKTFLFYLCFKYYLKT